MSAFELNIYGENDAIIKTYSTEFIRWGVFLQAVQIHEELANKSPAEQLVYIGDFVKKLFPNLTSAELENANSDDVINNFWILVNKANRIGRGGGDAKKK